MINFLYSVSHKDLESSVVWEAVLECNYFWIDLKADSKNRTSPMNKKEIEMKSRDNKVHPKDKI